MSPIEIPVATLPVKLIMGCGCACIVFAVLWWGLPKFATYLRVVTGREPRKPGTQTIHLVLGLFVYAIIFAPGFIAAVVFLEITTTPPSIISADGISGGGGVLASRTTIPWEQVERIDCIQRRDHSVKQLKVVSGTKRVEVGGYDLSVVRDAIWAHAPPTSVRPCFVPLGRGNR